MKVHVKKILEIKIKNYSYKYVLCYLTATQVYQEFCRELLKIVLK